MDIVTKKLKFDHRYPLGVSRDMTPFRLQSTLTCRPNVKQSNWRENLAA